MQELENLALLLKALSELTQEPRRPKQFDMDPNRGRYLDDLATLEDYPERKRGGQYWAMHAQDYEVANAWKRAFGTEAEREHILRLDENRENREINELMSALEGAAKEMGELT